MSSNTKPLLDVSSASEVEKLAVQRVLKAGVKAPESVILHFVQCSGAKSILAAKLYDIRAVANAF